MRSTELRKARARLKKFKRWVKLAVIVTAVLAIAAFSAALGKRMYKRRKTSRMNTYFYSAVASTEKGDYTGAAGAYNKMLTHDPDNVDAHINLGILHSLEGAHEEALGHFEEARDAKASAPVEIIDCNIGNLYLSNGDFDRAIENYTQAAGKNPGYIKPRLMLAAIYEYTGKRKHAIRQYEEILKIVKKYQEQLKRSADASGTKMQSQARALAFRIALWEGFVHEKKGESEQALEKYGDLLNEKPDFIPALIRRGIVLFNQGEYEKAEGELKQALEIDRELSELKRSLADLYFLEGKRDRALTLFHNLAGAYPQSLVLKDYLAGALLKDGKYSDSEKAFKEALEIDPEYGRAHGGLGYVYFKLARYSEAEEYLKKAISLSPGEPDNYYNLACLHSKNGNAEEAFKWLSEAAQRGFGNRSYIMRDPDLKNLRENKIFTRFKL